MLALGAGANLSWPPPSHRQHAENLGSLPFPSTQIHLSESGKLPHLTGLALSLSHFYGYPLHKFRIPETLLRFFRKIKTNQTDLELWGLRVLGARNIAPLTPDNPLQISSRHQNLIAALTCRNIDFFLRKSRFIDHRGKIFLHSQGRTRSF